jgi:endonuclease/exonuclease/phosphatase family metal-dependent hydrolase
VITLATYNIQYSLGRDGAYDLDRVIGEVANADVIALQEVERFVTRSGDEDQPARIAELLPDHHLVYGPAVDVDGSYRDDGGRLVRRRRQFGNMLLSRHPIRWSRNHLLPKEGMTNQPGAQRAMLEAAIELDGRLLRVASTHLDHLDRVTRLPQVEHALRLLVDDHARSGSVWSGKVSNPTWAPLGPQPTTPALIVMGDLNFRPGSREYELFVGEWSEEHGRMTLRDRFVDAYAAAGHDWNDGASHMNGGRIDHIMVQTRIAAGVLGCRIDSAAQGSDHYPVWLDFDEAVLPDAEA